MLSFLKYFNYTHMHQLLEVTLNWFQSFLNSTKTFKPSSIRMSLPKHKNCFEISHVTCISVVKIIQLIIFLPFSALFHSFVFWFWSQRTLINWWIMFINQPRWQGDRQHQWQQRWQLRQSIAKYTICENWTEAMGTRFFVLFILFYNRQVMLKFLKIQECRL